MADEKALPPAEGGEKAPDETLEIKSPVPADKPETTRLQRRKKLSLRQDETGEVTAASETVETPAPNETQGGVVLQDPTRRRDTNTASLKRLRPEDFNSEDADDSDNTETVNIKVIKEQKKQFRNMMTSSQTLKVNEDGSPAEGPLTSGGKVDEDVTRTETIPRPAGDPAATAEEPAPPAATTKHNPKSTLKIKAPPGVAPAQAGGASRPGATLKIKAPAPADADSDPSARTVKRTVAGRPGKTLKLRQTPQPQGDPSAATIATPRAAAPQPVAEDTKGAPGVMYILFSAASLILLGLLLWKMYDSSNTLFNGAVFPWM